jgi:hypothetical protein
VYLTNLSLIASQASSITGFGSIHAAILSVASMVLKNGMNTTDFQPQSEAEYVDSQTADLGSSILDYYACFVPLTRGDRWLVNQV